MPPAAATVVVVAAAAASVLVLLPLARGPCRFSFSVGVSSFSWKKTMKVKKQKLMPPSLYICPPLDLGCALTASQLL
jgi:hypothetical protein